MCHGGCGFGFENVQFSDPLGHWALRGSPLRRRMPVQEQRRAGPERKRECDGVRAMDATTIPFASTTGTGGVCGQSCRGFAANQLQARFAASRAEGKRFGGNGGKRGTGFNIVGFDCANRGPPPRVHAPTCSPLHLVGFGQPPIPSPSNAPLSRRVPRHPPPAAAPARRRGHRLPCCPRPVYRCPSGAARNLKRNNVSRRYFFADNPPP